ncbi:MAG: LacI family DNA-binding transcriptional regulator [Eubacterium sp.]|nr:LacI family DNA-binding transcriptional regulator [Eubacterium sp.]MBR1673842.1 LacI family DNA-binding transcriptional regulator [Eubacterium sp.]
MNIYDIAQMANVSIATVSRVVNNSPKVSEKTRKKVMDIIDRYGYTPNVFAQGLGLNTMHTIGILVPTISDLYISRAVACIEENLHEMGYDIILSCSGYTAKSKEVHIEMLLSKRIDALILVGSTYAGSDDETHNTDYIAKAAEEIPVFIINGLIDGENIYCNAAEDYRISYDVTKELITRGRKNIIFLTDSKSYSANQKKRGYENALKDAGLTVYRDHMLFMKNDIDMVRSLFCNYDYLDYDAVFATDDAMAIGVLKYLESIGKKVPAEVSVIGYNNSQLCKCTTPELTSVDNKVELVALQTVNSLKEVLNGNDRVMHKNMVACELIRRGTM